MCIVRGIASRGVNSDETDRTYSAYSLLLEEKYRKSEIMPHFFGSHICVNPLTLLFILARI